jgi:hypothetical protein
MLSPHACRHEVGTESERKRMIRISGRLRHRSTQIPAGMLSRRLFEMRISASRRPKIIEKTIPMAAISRLTKKPSSRNLRLLPLHTHSQFSGLKMYSIAQTLIA